MRCSVVNFCAKSRVYVILHIKSGNIHDIHVFNGTDFVKHENVNVKGTR